MVALGDRQLHRIAVGRNEQRERLHRARQNRAVVEHIRTAAFGQREPADVGNEETVLEHKIGRDLLCSLHFLRERHIRLVQRFAAVCGGLGAIEQLFALHLVLEERLCAAEHLVVRQFAVLGEIRQVDEADEIPRGNGRQQRPQIDRDLRDNRLVAAAELAVERPHHKRREHGQRADTDGLGIFVQLRKRECHLGDDLGGIVAPLYRGRMNGFGLFPDAVRRKFMVGKLFIAVGALLGRPAGVQTAHRAVILDRTAAVFEILEQYAPDELLEAAPVRDRVLIFHVDGLFVIPDKE